MLKRFTAATLCAGLALALSATSTFAQDAPPPGPPPGSMPEPGPAGHHPMRDKFMAANSTHDGKLTLDQAEAAGIGYIVRNFSAIDAEHKGYITWDNVHYFMKMRKMERQNHGQPPPS